MASKAANICEYERCFQLATTFCVFCETQYCEICSECCLFSGHDLAPHTPAVLTCADVLNAKRVPCFSSCTDEIEVSDFEETSQELRRQTRNKQVQSYVNTESVFNAPLPTKWEPLNITITVDEKKRRKSQDTGNALKRRSTESLGSFPLSHDVTVDTRVPVQLTLPPLLDAALLPFQREGVAFVVAREGRCLIGDDMGLGKCSIFK